MTSLDSTADGSNTGSSSSTASSTSINKRVPRGSTSSGVSAELTLSSSTNNSSIANNKVPLGLLRKAYRRLTNSEHPSHNQLHSRVPSQFAQSQAQSQAHGQDQGQVNPPVLPRLVTSPISSPHPSLVLMPGSATSKDSHIFERSASSGNIYGSGTCCCQDLEHGEEVLVSSEGIPTHLSFEDFTIPTLDLTTELVTDPHVSFELIKLKLCDRKRSRSLISNSLMSRLDGDGLKEADDDTYETEEEEFGEAVEEGETVEEEEGEEDDALEYREADDTKISVASVRSAPYAMLLRISQVNESVITDNGISEIPEKISQLQRSQSSSNGDYLVLDYYSFNELVHHRPKYVSKSKDYILDPTSQAMS